MRFAATITLNIGLYRAFASSADIMDRALEELSASDFTIQRYRARLALEGGTESGTFVVAGEDTLVLEVQGVGNAGEPEEFAGVTRAVYGLSESLGEDCIAFRGVASYDDLGEDKFHIREALVGPRAGEWGVFDPKYFIPFDGWQS